MRFININAFSYIKFLRGIAIALLFWSVSTAIAEDSTTKKWAEFLIGAQTTNLPNRLRNVQPAETFELKPEPILMWEIPTTSSSERLSEVIGIPTPIRVLEEKLSPGRRLLLVPQSAIDDASEPIKQLLAKYGQPKLTGLMGAPEANGRTFLVFDPNTQNAFQTKFGILGADGLDLDAREILISDAIAKQGLKVGEQPSHILTFKVVEEKESRYFNVHRSLEALEAEMGPNRTVLQLHTLLGYSTSSEVNHIPVSSPARDETENKQKMQNLIKTLIEAAKERATNVDIKAGEQKALTMILEQEEQLLRMDPFSLNQLQGAEQKKLQQALEGLNDWMGAHYLETLLVKHSDLLSRNEKSKLAAAVAYWKQNGKLSTTSNDKALERLATLGLQLSSPSGPIEGERASTILYPDWVRKLAQRAKLSELEWLKTQYIPKLAELEARSNLAGLWTENHTQNVYAVVDIENGYLKKLFYKGVSDSLLEPALLSSDPFSTIMPMIKDGASISNFTHFALREQNDAMKAGVHFRRLTGQSILFNPLIPSSAVLASTFMDEYRSAIRKYSGIEIEFDDDLKAMQRRSERVASFSVSEQVLLLRNVLSAINEPSVAFAVSFINQGAAEALQASFDLLEKGMQTVHDQLARKAVSKWMETREWEVMDRRKRHGVSIDKLVEQAKSQKRLLVLEGTNYPLGPSIYKKGVVLKKDKSSQELWLFNPKGNTPIARILPMGKAMPMPLNNCDSGLGKLRGSLR